MPWVVVVAGHNDPRLSPASTSGSSSISPGGGPDPGASRRRGDDRLVAYSLMRGRLVGGAVQGGSARRASRASPVPCIRPTASTAIQPSTDGPDVEAYKRTVSRAGRWEWQPFDDAYSNGFAHGKGGNVVDTGVAGRAAPAAGIDDTGWIGKTTFNFLRSIRVPPGKPHAGEMAMDARAVELINAGLRPVRGPDADPAAPTSGTRRGADRAGSGTDRHRRGSCRLEPEQVRRLVRHGRPAVVRDVRDLVLTQLGGQDSARDSLAFRRGRAMPMSPTSSATPARTATGLGHLDDPSPATSSVYDWDGDGVFDHVGIFEKWTTGTLDFRPIEGNTSTADNSNGGR